MSNFYFSPRNKLGISVHNLSHIKLFNLIDFFHYNVQYQKYRGNLNKLSALRVPLCLSNAIIYSNFKNGWQALFVFMDPSSSSLLPDDCMCISPFICLLYIDLKSYAKSKQNKILPVAVHQT